MSQTVEAAHTEYETEERGERDERERRIEFVNEWREEVLLQWLRDGVHPQDVLFFLFFCSFELSD